MISFDGFWCFKFLISNYVDTDLNGTEWEEWRENDVAKRNRRLLPDVARINRRRLPEAWADIGWLSDFILFDLIRFVLLVFIRFVSLCFGLFLIRVLFVSYGFLFDSSGFVFFQCFGKFWQFSMFLFWYVLIIFRYVLLSVELFW